VGEDMALVVGHVPEAEADSLGLFDDPVEDFRAGVGDLLGQGDQDGRPPGLDGVREPGGLSRVGVEGGGVVEVGQPPPDSSTARTRRGGAGGVPSHPRRRRSPRSDHWPSGSRRGAAIACRRGRFAPVSSSCRFTQTGSATVPRRPSSSRVTRCRTSVTIWWRARRGAICRPRSALGAGPS
jgi:hypothetical protein